MSSNTRSLAKRSLRQPLAAEAVQLTAGLNQGSIHLRVHNDAENTRTQNRMDQLERNLRETEARLEQDFQERIGTVEEELRQKGEKIDEELRQKGEKIDRLNGLIENMAINITILNEKIEQLSNDCAGLEQSLAEKDKILKKSKKDQETLQKELDLKSKELEASENERKKLQVLLDEKTRTLQDLMGAMGTIMERVTRSDAGNALKKPQEESNKRPKTAQVPK